jgi:DNA-binding CsgD family transcriptional regulator
MPHLDGAIGLHRRLCGAELMAGHMAAVLDQLPHAVILVSGNGRRVATNREADRILQNRDGLVHERGELRAATQAATDRLRTALQAAVRTGAGEGLDAPTPLALPRPSGRRPLAVMVAPLPAQRVAFNDDGAAAAVFVTDPEHGRTPDYKAIAALFGLTPAESRLVTCLVTGQNLEEAATSLQVKLESVRTRLKTVFEKTGTHRQAELVRLVMNSGPGLGPGAR